MSVEERCFSVCCLAWYIGETKNLLYPIMKFKAVKRAGLVLLQFLEEGLKIGERPVS